MTELRDMANDYNELVRENDKLKEELKKIKQRFEPQAFTDLMNEVENEYNLQKENERLKQIILGNEEEIAELKKESNQLFLEGAKRVEALEKENAELKAENQKWKDEWQEQVQKVIDEGYARTLQTIQLTEAKEIIKLFSWDLRNRSYEPVKDIEQAEEFLGELE